MGGAVVGECVCVFALVVCVPVSGSVCVCVFVHGPMLLFLKHARVHNSHKLNCFASISHPGILLGLEEQLIPAQG